MARHTMRLIVGVGIALSFAYPALAEREGDPLILQNPSGVQAQEMHVRSDTRGRKQEHRLALGVSYLGAQARWYFGPKWSTEFHYQFGKASSNYGDVTAKVYGLRIYRTLKTYERMSWYAGPEMAHATAPSAARPTTG